MSAPFPAVTPRLLAALAVVSAAVTAQQVVLLQVLGWTHWHHFAYLVIAIALLGFGVAGTVLTLARTTLVRHGAGALAWLLLATAVTMPLGVRLAQAPLFAIDLPLVFANPAGGWRLVALCGLLLPPFFAAGLLTGLLLTAHATAPARLYAASLAGAGMGGVAGLALAAWVEPPRLAAAVGALALVAALLRWRDSSNAQRMAAVAGAAVIAALGGWPGELASSQFKPLSRALDLPQARIIAHRPSLRGWIQVVSAPALRPAPALSFAYAGDIPARPELFVNGLPRGSLPAAADLRDGGWLSYTTDAAAFALARPRRVLLLENGPGGWAALARARGAQQVTVVEPNGAMVDLLTTGRTPLAPEWRDPAVRLVVAEPRVFLAAAGSAFDVIRFPDVGALGGTSGLGAAAGQFLLTREAMRSAWARLSPTGILTVTAWLDYPERNPLRLLATMAEELQSLGAPPPRHIAALRSWAAVTFLVRRAGWDPATTAALRAFCAARGFDLLLAPDVTANEQQINNQWQNPAFFTLVRALTDGPREPVYRAAAFHLFPPTDQRPYFSQFVRLSRLRQLGTLFGLRTLPFFELGSLVIAVTAVLLAALASACLLLPLALNRARDRDRARTRPPRSTLLYFGGLGAGFMAFEMAAMLEAEAWLGNPVLATGVVLTALLLASGGGSWWSERLAAAAPVQRRVLLALVGLLVLSALVLVGGAAAARGWPAGIRLAAAVGAVVVPGFAMGMAFPLGLRRLAASSPGLLAWAWAINSAVSVATPALVLLLAMTLGFPAAFAAAALAYTLALLATARSWSPPCSL